MNKKIVELKTSSQSQRIELAAQMEDLMIRSRKNIEDIKLQLADAEKELAYRRSLGENI